jgi:endonuclease-3
MAGKESNVVDVIHTLEKRVAGLPKPMCTVLAEQYNHDPFIILIACLLSLRARDSVTMPIVQKLLLKARTPQALYALSDKQLERIIYSLGFYRRKTAVLKAVAHDLIERFDGKVPDNEEELLSLPGVGRKTANLVLSEAFEKPAIAVDVHVHRLANQLGLVATKTPEQTEQALMKIVPRKYWRSINRLLVTCGQQKCDLSTIRFKK